MTEEQKMKRAAVQGLEEPNHKRRIVFNAPPKSLTHDPCLENQSTQILLEFAHTLDTPTKAISRVDPRLTQELVTFDSSKWLGCVCGRIYHVLVAGCFTCTCQHVFHVPNCGCGGVSLESSKIVLAENLRFLFSQETCNALNRMVCKGKSSLDSFPPIVAEYMFRTAGQLAAACHLFYNVIDKECKKKSRWIDPAIWSLVFQYFAVHNNPQRFEGF